MRLTPEEKVAILECVSAWDCEAEVYVFGSRVDAAKKGGDIDLLIVSQRVALMDKLALLVALERKLGERRIDVLVRPRSALTSDPFVVAIVLRAIRL